MLREKCALITSNFSRDGGSFRFRELRRETMRKLNYSLRDLYRTLDQPGDNPLREAHTRLDAAVRRAYGMADDVDPLTFLLELNLACSAKEKAGEKITPPGLPLPPE